MNSIPSIKSAKPDRSESKRIFWLMFTLIVFSWISIKMVLPALPELVDALHTDHSGVKLSVSIYLISFALSKLVWGAIVEKIGCRRTLHYSLIITLFGTFIAIVSFNLPLYIAGRALEGIGMGAAGPVSRKLLVNYFDRKTLSARISMINATAATMPALAPIFAGHLLHWINWQAIFGTFFLMTAILLYFILRLLPPHIHDFTNYEEFSTVKILKTYHAILKEKVFLGYTLPFAASIGGLLGYYSAMPYWYHVQLHIPKHLFAYFTVPTVAMYVFGLLFSGWLIKKKTVEAIMVYAASLSVAVTFLTLILAVFNTTPIISIVVAMSLFGFTAGLISPNASAGVLVHFKELAAPTSALVGVTVFGTASFTSAITMNMHINETLWAIVAYLGTLSVISLIASYFWIWLPSLKKNSL
ncbi:MAG: MFS transporter [Sulfurimonadaceae bacterium]